ncbi:unnamed protein product, partial [Amoebophrya sp. A120]
GIVGFAKSVFLPGLPHRDDENIFGGQIAPASDIFSVSDFSVSPWRNDVAAVDPRLLPADATAGRSQTRYHLSPDQGYYFICLLVDSTIRSLNASGRSGCHDAGAYLVEGGRGNATLGTAAGAGPQHRQQPQQPGSNSPFLDHEQDYPGDVERDNSSSSWSQEHSSYIEEDSFDRSADVDDLHSESSAVAATRRQRHDLPTSPGAANGRVNDIATGSPS